jgi:pimeloyl-ACP methyl ester carboxylesterase
MTDSANELSIKVAGCRIEATLHGPSAERAPTLVLLHEGLGCVAMWRDFPQKLAARTGYGVLVYSRPGYGNSDPVSLPRPLSYMHDDAFDVLPHVLDQAGVKKTILVGHSDGASIATIYAGGRQDFRVRGLALMAPHFFVEDVSIRKRTKRATCASA